MYKKGIYKILANEPLTATVWRMVLGGDTQWITAPGQFVDIALEGRYLRRPISSATTTPRRSRSSTRWWAREPHR